MTERAEVDMLGTILEFARRNRIIATNPARGVRRFPDKKRRRFLSFDELTALGKESSNVLPLRAPQNG